METEASNDSEATPEAYEPPHHDFIIAGGGLAGILCALVFYHKFPHLKVALLERNSYLGGRLMLGKRGPQQWGAGLSFLSEELYNYWGQLLAEDAHGQDLASFTHHSQEKTSLVIGRVMDTLALKEFFDERGIKKLAGRSATEEWTKLVDQYTAEIDEKEDLKPLGRSYKGARKAGAAVALEQFAQGWGLPDIWQSTVGILKAQLESLNDRRIFAEWGKPIDHIEAMLKVSNIKLHSSTSILRGRYLESLERWQLTTSNGMCTSNHLIVAMSPWDALDWLERPYLPPKLANYISRSRPTSLVTLSSIIDAPESLKIEEVPWAEFIAGNNRILIAAEKVFAVVEKNSVCFQVALDQEVSLDAPAVVKAVKRLKRARDKFQRIHEDLHLEGEHIGLLPAAWTHPHTPEGLRAFRQIDELSNSKTNIAFCGDSYGSSLIGDQNIITSVNHVRSIIEKLEEN